MLASRRMLIQTQIPAVLRRQQLHLPRQRSRQRRLPKLPLVECQQARKTHRKDPPLWLRYDSFDTMLTQLQQNDDAIVSQSQSRPRSSASGRARTPSRKARENDESQAVQDAAAAVKDLRRSSRRVNTQCAELYEDLERVEATQET